MIRRTIDILKKCIPIEMRNYLRTVTLYKKTVMRHLLLRKPDMMSIELTDRCNIRCSYCPKSVELNRDAGDMDFELFKETVDKCNEIQTFILVGFGEPLLYKKLFDAIKYVKSKGKKVFLTTNGTLLTKEIGQKLIDLKVDLLIISLNVANSYNYLKYSKSEKYDVVVDNTKNFLELLGQDKPYTYLQVLTRINSEIEILEFKKFWKPYLKNKNASMIVEPLISWGGVVNTEISENRYPCTQLYRNRFINREGNAIACCSCIPFNDGILVLGNIKDCSLEELYSNEKMRLLHKWNREGILTNNVPLCTKCSSWDTLPNIWIKNPFYKFIGRKWY